MTEGSEVQAIRTLLNLPHASLISVTKHSLGKVDILRQLYNSISTELPTDIVSTKVPSGIPDPNAEALTFNFDEGHCGRYSLPHCAENGATLSFDYVERSPDPALYIREYLTFRAPFPWTSHREGGPSSQSSPNRSSDGVGSDVDQGSQIFFSPGLNSLHEPRPGRQFATQRLQHYIRVLLHVPMAQIHTGTQMDQGDAVLDASSAPLLRGLLSISDKLFGSFGQPSVEGDKMVWKAATLDSMQTALSQLNLIDTPLKKCYRTLLEATRGSTPRPVTFLAYSRASVELMAALRKHIEESTDRGEKKKAVRRRLRAFVTVVTIGVACSGFPDGPAYLHVSTAQDVLVRRLGVSDKRRRGAGDDAVFVHCRSPYNDKTFDSHNFGAVSSQLLSVMMRANSVHTLRGLWERGQGQELRIPFNLDELVAAVVVVTSGWQWLWKPAEAMSELPADRFPSREEALQLLARWLGTDYARQLTSLFPETKPLGSELN